VHTQCFLIDYAAVKLKVVLINYFLLTYRACFFLVAVVIMKWVYVEEMIMCKTNASAASSGVGFPISAMCPVIRKASVFSTGVKFVCKLK